MEELAFKSIKIIPELTTFLDQICPGVFLNHLLFKILGGVFPQPITPKILEDLKSTFSIIPLREMEMVIDSSRTKNSAVKTFNEIGGNDNHSPISFVYTIQ